MTPRARIIWLRHVFALEDKYERSFEQYDMFRGLRQRAQCWKIKALLGDEYDAEI